LWIDSTTQLDALDHVLSTVESENGLANGSTDIWDPDRLRASSLALRRLGFGSRVCLHPAQVDVVNEVFSSPWPPWTSPRSIFKIRTTVQRLRGERSQASTDAELWRSCRLG
jgi:hypothetical protein